MIMRAKRKRNNAPTALPRRKATKKRYIIAALALISLAAVFGVCLMSYPSDPVVATDAGIPADSSKSDSSGAATSPKADEGRLQRLIGRWVRPDGGYIIEIKGIEGNGRLNAAYYNPNPINVARAEASVEGSDVRVFIELRDVNYPGCTYNLEHNSQTDQLFGQYYQAAVQETFEVVFSRLK